MNTKLKMKSKSVAMFAVCALFIWYLAMPASAEYKEGEVREVPAGQVQTMSTTVDAPVKRDDDKVVKDNSTAVTMGIAVAGVVLISGYFVLRRRKKSTK